MVHFHFHFISFILICMMETFFSEVINNDDDVTTVITMTSPTPSTAFAKEVAFTSNFAPSTSTEPTVPENLTTSETMTSSIEMTSANNTMLNIFGIWVPSIVTTFILISVEMFFIGSLVEAHDSSRTQTNTTRKQRRARTFKFTPASRSFFLPVYEIGIDPAMGTLPFERNELQLPLFGKKKQRSYNSNFKGFLVTVTNYSYFL